MRIDIVTPALASNMAEWYDAALQLPEISRYMTITTNIDIPNDTGSHWSYLTLMDDSRRGLARVSPARSFNNTYCDMSLWVLPVESENTRRRIAGGLLLRAFKEARHRYGSKYVEWSVHGTNKESLHLSQRQAEQIGFKTEGAWDGMLGQWVDCYTFRVNLEQFFAVRNSCKSTKSKQSNIDVVHISV